MSVRQAQWCNTATLNPPTGTRSITVYGVTGAAPDRPSRHVSKIISLELWMQFAPRTQFAIAGIWQPKFSKTTIEPIGTDLEARQCPIASESSRASPFCGHRTGAGQPR